MILAISGLRWRLSLYFGQNYAIIFSKDWARVLFVSAVWIFRTSVFRVGIIAPKSDFDYYTHRLTITRWLLMLIILLWSFIPISATAILYAFCSRNCCLTYIMSWARAPVERARLLFEPSLVSTTNSCHGRRNSDRNPTRREQLGPTRGLTNTSQWAKPNWWHRNRTGKAGWARIRDGPNH